MIITSTDQFFSLGKVVNMSVFFMYKSDILKPLYNFHKHEQMILFSVMYELGHTYIRLAAQEIIQI